MTNTWTATTGTFIWTDGANWSSGAAPTDIDEVLFAAPGAGENPYTVTFDSGVVADADTVVFDDPNMTLIAASGDTLNWHGGVFLNAGTISLDGANAEWARNDSTHGTLVVGNGTIIGDANTTDEFGLGVLSASEQGTIYFTGGGGVIIAKAGSAGSLLEITDHVAATGDRYHDENDQTQTAGAGQFIIDNGASLAFDDTIAATTTVTFAGSTGSLVENFKANILSDNAANLTVTVAGMSVGTGSTPPDTIDIAGDGGATLDAASSLTSSGATIIIDNAGNGGKDTFTLIGDYSGDVVNTASDGTGGTLFYLDSVCFASGTHIRTADGDRAVETLKEGDLAAVCQDGEVSFQPIKWIGYRTLDLTKQPRLRHSAPVRIMRNALGENLPARDLAVSPDHCLFLDGKLIPAKLLVNDMTIRQDLDAQAVTYYHVEMERHAILLAEGVEAESYLDTGNRAFFSNAGLALILHPEFHVNAGLRCWETDACAPLAVSPAAVLPVWRPLADRAVALGYAPPVHATTTEADIHLVADGRRIDTIAVKGQVHSFMVPAGVRSLTLASRSVVPNTLTRYLDDPREIGVAVRGIVIRGMAGQAEYAADHPALARGWHAPEATDGALWRWSKGNGALPVGLVDGPVIVDVTIGETTTYLVDDRRIGRADYDRRVAA
jgi:antigen 43